MQAVDIRAADADRERVLAELQRHTAAGRLSIDEFAERAACVYRSRTMGELAVQTADLPPDANSDASKQIPRAIWTALILAAVAVALLGLAAVATAGPMGGVGCGW
ncbi:DUF1707 SHOCT-like domain-containing protein [Mycobacterium hubeiense]|uniref:DUF1707 SHOCT-like domain-containing protein n=1 Tax=Mycobacterium hubeiense TaxID=1867256 RepID=UPI000C7ED1B8|nr:DUF1707 domain-containing protein [Mycobacterium sp. QGD 101]